MIASECLLLGSSIQGAAHKRKNKPNQDAITWQQNLPGKLPVIMAVADGHGSSKSFRSQKGADFAVKVAINTLYDFLVNIDSLSNISSIKRLAEEKLSREIVDRWLKIVNHDLNSNPFTEEEKTLLGGNNAIAYGTTLLAVLVTKTFILFFQLGDGDILVVSKDNNVSHVIPKDQRLFANETTSLCAPAAWRDGNLAFLPVNEFPKMIMLSTDGYSNSFNNDNDFSKAALDFHSMLEDKSLDFLSSNIDCWLNETSEQGSGDDITVGLIYFSLNKDIESDTNSCDPICFSF
jgi:serine/threonine protein phosphatase PrpC